jgi:psiF repeat
MEQRMKTTTLLVSAVALAFTFGVAMAKTDKKVPAKPRTAQSIECSKQADAKALHGKERKAFRAKCKKETLGKTPKKAA